ncbi:class I SAM-dependent methyltransferase [Nocardioides sp. W7]|uniref:class I SAM-dependent methyltransferase n=1 Tax=Nocardioides sp. W7 TaxID=2931390 RepID=UPI001FD47906|nr:class I SAM-dependent methyltransferase [Nocardioides sp. W7]
MQIRERLRNLGYDTLLRVETKGIVQTNIPDGCHAASADYAIVSAVLDDLDLRPDDVLVDIGCGKGRVICLAARRRLARVIGIDLSPEIVAVAAENVLRLRGARSPVDVVVADAVTYDYSDVTCAYLFNPFEHFVLDRVLAKIEADRAGAPFRCAFVNLSDVQRETFEQHDWLRLTEERVLGGLSVARYEART